jgi:putative addiction module component (TIGR02574 family)
MTHEAKELLQKALALPDDERAELAGTLMASLDAIEDPHADAVWQEEIARRAEQVRQGKVSTTPWIEVQQKARNLTNGQ